MKKYKVLHLPTTVGGNPQGLSKALQRLGVDSTSMTLEQNHFQYPTDIVLWKDSDSRVLKETKRLLFFYKVIKNYDIIHYNSGTTLMKPMCLVGFGESVKFAVLRFFYGIYTNILQDFELRIFSFFKKKIYVTYQGDDARQGDYSLKHFDISIAQRVGKNYYNSFLDNFKRRKIKKISRYATAIYAVNPDLLHVLPQGTTFVPYSHIFMDEWVPNFTQAENRPLRFIHAPSHRAVKGSELVIEAVKQLKEEGYVFDFTLVEGMSNAEAKKLYETSDVLIDQLFAGWYGGLAVEAMALGKPVVVYLREEDLHFIDPKMRNDIPLIKTNPDTIKATIKTILEMPREELVELAVKSRAYVEKWHDPVRIAANLKSDYEKNLL